MNERIKKQFKRVDEMHPVLQRLWLTTLAGGGIIGVDEIEKFAELIVRECIRMCDVADMSLLEHDCVKEASGTQSAKDFIKEHFGVEE